MNILEIEMRPSPATEPAPVKEPKTKPSEPSTSPGKDNDPWNVPSPQVKPTPKA